MIRFPRNSESNIINKFSRLIAVRNVLWSFSGVLHNLMAFLALLFLLALSFSRSSAIRPEYADADADNSVNAIRSISRMTDPVITLPAEKWSILPVRRQENEIVYPETNWITFINTI